MSTVIERRSTEAAIISEFEVTQQQIAEAVELAGQATVDGPEDKDGMKLCHEYRMGLVKMRTTIEKTRKELKADVLERGRLIDSVAKELMAPIPPAESRLKELEETAKREQERLDAIEREKKEAEIARRCELANSVAWSIPIAMLSTLPAEDFERAYAEKKAEHEQREAEAKRQAELQRQEQERLEKLAQEQAARQAEIERQQAELEAKQQAIAKAEQEARQKKLGWRTQCLSMVRASMPTDELMALTDEEFDSLLEVKREEDNRRKEAEAAAAAEEAERKRKEEEERIAKAAQEEADRREQARLAAIREEEAKAQREREEAARIAALAPDREKIAAFIQSVDALAVPALSTDAMSQKRRIIAAKELFLESLGAIADELK